MKNKKLFAILTLVCFMLTLMPVAAFADSDTTTVADMSMLYLTSTETVVSTGSAVDYTFSARDNAGDKVPGANGYIYIWAKDTNGNISSALDLVSPAAAEVTGPQYAKVVAATGADTNIKVSFARAGEYKLYAAYSTNSGIAKVSDLTPAKGAGEDVITVLGETANPDNYTMTVSNATVGTETDDYDWKIASLIPNNVSNEYTLHFENNSKVLTGKTITIATDSANITVDKETATTNYNGDVKIKVAASREGKYSIYVDIEGKEFVILVDCTNTSAAYIETTTQPTNLIAQFTTASEFISQDEEAVVFTITDINGNLVKDADEPDNGANGIFARKLNTNKTQAKYLFFTEKPATSALTDAKLSLMNIGDGKYALNIGGTLDAEGVYTVKAILDNGSVATATWEVKRFQTPVELRIGGPSTVELGKSFSPSLKYADVNGVVKKATDAKLAATGYAIYSFNGKKVVLKTDEKYAGQSINLTAVSERYDLVATKVVKIAAEATDIAFEKDSLEVDVNNKVVWNVVDSEGNEVKLNDVANFQVRYVVLDAPEGAKVSVYDLTGNNFDGDGKMALTSNKVGNVTVQAVAQVQVKSGTATETPNALGAIQTKYYTGTQIFAVGNGSVGDVVVMSIGSNEIVINDKKATIDAAPIVQNDRTYVPFRALAEAFGAEVAYDEATQAVTAELNGVTVVMTIGSATYTVNGAEKTMDVAPFINGSRTMVPVRFVAEAFGIKVIPTYDENGATADILFNL